MIDIANRTVSLQGHVQKILSHQVWFATPWGLITDIDEAISKCIALDVDPDMNIHAVPVAVTETTYEIMR